MQASMTDDIHQRRYKVMSWSIVHIPATGRMVYDITFRRLPSEPSMEAVLQRPWTEEVEDYAKYKQLKRTARERRQEAERKAMEAKPGAVVVSGSDGTIDEARPFWPAKQDSVWDVYEDQFVESPKGSVVVRSTNRNVR
jgi:hypothetical protein